MSSADERKDQDVSGSPASEAPADLKDPTPPSPEPTLGAYYAETPVQAAAWGKAVRAARIGAFPQADKETTLQILAERDPDLRRTLALAQLANAPGAIQRWVKEATRRTLEKRLDGQAIDQVSPSLGLLASITTALTPGLRAPKKDERVSAENLLLLSVRDLLGSRELDPIDTLCALSVPLSDDRSTGEGAAGRKLKKRILRAGISLLRDLSSVAACASERLDSAERGRLRARELSSALEADLQTAKERTTRLSRHVSERDQEIGRLKAEIAGRLKELDEQRQIGAHERAAIAARCRVLLVEQLDSLLSDAADALATEPVDPEILQVARDRIASASSAISRGAEWLDQYSA